LLKFDGLGLDSGLIGGFFLLHRLLKLAALMDEGQSLGQLYIAILEHHIAVLEHMDLLMKLDGHICA